MTALPPASYSDTAADARADESAALSDADRERADALIGDGDGGSGRMATAEVTLVGDAFPSVA